MPSLPKKDRSAYVSKRFYHYWDAIVAKANAKAAAAAAARQQQQPHQTGASVHGSSSGTSQGGVATTAITLMNALRQSFGHLYLVALLMNILSYTFLILQPIFVRRLVSLLDDPQSESYKLYLESFYLVLVSFLASLFTNQMFFWSVRGGNASRISLATAVYEKSLKLSRSARQTASSGSTVNIMSNDTQRVFDASLLLQFLLLSPVVLVIALALMVAEVGVAAVAGVALMVLLSPIQIYISRLTGRNRRLMLQYSDARVKLMAEAMQGIKVVKLYAWEEAIAEKIDQLRQKEMRHLRVTLTLQAVNQTILFVAPPAVTFLIMSMYAGLGNEVNVQNTFSMLAFINILRSPLTVLPMVVNMTSEAWVSLNRIHRFITLPEIKPQPRKPYDPSIPYAVTVRHASFRWAPDQITPTLRNISLTIKRGELVAIIGAVGAGKSSLFAALLGEMELDRNNSALEEDEEPTSLNGTVAYVSQESWIRNLTVRDNILFGLPYDESQYRRVLHASCLSHDLSILPDGDQTEIGERGINLSGGQKARMQVARALYRRSICDIYLLDDPFAAVDMSVGSHIFHHAVQDLLKDKTRIVILSSHLHLLPHFDRIIVMDTAPTHEEEQDGDGAGRVKKEQDPSIGKDVAAAAANGHANANANTNGKDTTHAGNGHSIANGHKPASDADGSAHSESAQSGRIIAEGTFNELKPRFYALMSQQEAQQSESPSRSPSLSPMASPLTSPSCRSHDELSALDLGMGGVGDDDDEDSGEIQPDVDAESFTMHERVRGASISKKILTQTQQHHTQHRLAQHRSHSQRQRTSRPSATNGHQEAQEMKANDALSTQSKDSTHAPAALMEKEVRVQGAVTLSVWVSYFGAGEKSLFGAALLIFMLILFITSQAARVGSDTWLSLWADGGVFEDKSTNFWVLIYFAIVGSTLLLSIARSFLFAYGVALRASRRVHLRSLSQLLRASIPLFFDVTPAGRILNRFSRDLEQMDTLLAITMFQFLQNWFTLLGVIAVTIAGSYYMIALLVPIGILFRWIQTYFRASQRELKRIESTTRSPIFSLFAETLNGLSTIRAYGLQEEFEDRNEFLIEKNSQVFSVQWLSQRWLALRLDWVSLLVILCTCLLMVGLRDSIGVGVASLSIVYSLQFTGLLQMTTRNSVDTENYLTSVERLMDFKAIKTEKAARVPAHDPPTAWPQHGAIRFDALQLRYRPDLPLVLKGATATIPPRAKVGICGRTGSGKSSLMLALFRLVEPCGGTIMIDDVDIQKIGLQTLRNKLAIIPQDPVMFSATLRFNIDPFNQCSDDEIHQALARVHLSDLVASFELGLQHPVSENGESLSQGQRQLVCIARALLRKSKIIILDEATSSVDAATDALIQETIRVNFAHATVLTIAHRLETIVDSDAIMLLKDGNVAEFGSPSDLLSRPSDFRSLVLEGGADNLARLQALAREADKIRLNNANRVEVDDDKKNDNDKSKSETVEAVTFHTY